MPSKKSPEVSDSSEDFAPQIDLSASAAELERRAEASAELDPEAIKSRISTRFEDFYGSSDEEDDGESLGYLGGAVGGEEDDEEPLGYLGGEAVEPDKPKLLQGFFDGQVSDPNASQDEVQGLFDGKVGRAQAFYQQQRGSSLDTGGDGFDTASEFQGKATEELPAAGGASFLTGETQDSFSSDEYESEDDGYGIDTVDGYDDPAEDALRRPSGRGTGSSFIADLESSGNEPAYGGGDTLDEMFADIDTYGEGGTTTDSVFPEREAFVSTDDDGALSSHEASRIIDAISRAPDEPSRVDYDHFTEPQEGDYHTGTQLDVQVGPKLWEAGYQPATEAEAKRSMWPLLVLFLLLLGGAGAIFWKPILELVNPPPPTVDPGELASVTNEDMLAALLHGEDTGHLNFLSLTEVGPMIEVLGHVMSDPKSTESHKRALTEVIRRLKKADDQGLDLRKIEDRHDLVAILEVSQKLEGSEKIGLIQELMEVVRRSESYGTLGVESFGDGGTP